MKTREINMEELVRESLNSAKHRRAKLARKSAPSSVPTKAVKHSNSDLHQLALSKLEPSSSKPPSELGSLDLLDFDDTEFDIRSPTEWINLVPAAPKGSKKMTGLKAKGLRIKANVGSNASFETCVICAYEEETNYFTGLWYDDETALALSRLDLFF